MTETEQLMGYLHRRNIERAEKAKEEANKAKKGDKK